MLKGVKVQESIQEYLFLESTIAICNECMQRIDGKIILKDKKIFLKKYCHKHGVQLELLEEDSDYYYRKRDYDKPGTPIIPETNILRGCPFDCGLCPSHEQHTCNALIDITDRCDMGCPICYASSGKGNDLDLEKIEKMMDFFQEKEGGKAEILQISGGEPTVHKDILKILSLAKEKKFRYVMLNTNGLRIARDEQFVKELSKFRGGFEIYLQFDGFKEETYKVLRGNPNLLDTKMKAIEILRKYKIAITLVSTIKKGLNDDELGKIFEFGVNTPGIRGVNFQPVAYFGRITVDKKEIFERITLSGIIKLLEEQTAGAVKKSDIVPLPCNIEKVAVCYFYKDKSGFIPLTRNFKVKNYLPLIDNTFAFDASRLLSKSKNLEEKHSFGKGILGTKGLFGCCNLDFIRDLSKIIPKGYSNMSEEEQMDYWDTHSFRLSIVSFIDKYNFDIKSIKKECIHFITPELKRIPFSTYNMFYRRVL